MPAHRNVFLPTALLGLLAVLPVPAQTQALQAQPPATPPVIEFIWMGGDDCPPCVAWRKSELPRLQQSPEFQTVRFTYVVKTIRSTVPAAVFLPAEIRRYKDQLDYASAGRNGSPQAAIMVNGQVYDYFRSARKAEDIEEMLAAIRRGTRYPFQRCLKVSLTWGECDVRG